MLDSIRVRFNDIIYRKNKVEYARKLGVRIGERCKIFSNPRECFSSEPWLITIGDHVAIAHGVHFIAHDGGAFALNEELCKDNPVELLGPIKVGNNVMIGMHAIILPNVTIGDNVIIAAGSVVTKNLPSNGVYGGVPAKFIKSIEEYKENAVKKASGTFGMSAAEKERYLCNIHPEWFKY